MNSVKQAIIEQAGFLHTLLLADGNKNASLCVEDVRSDYMPNDGTLTAEQMTVADDEFFAAWNKGVNQAVKFLTR